MRLKTERGLLKDQNRLTVSKTTDSSEADETTIITIILTGPMAIEMRTVRRENVEENPVKKIIRRIIRIIGLAPIILKVIEVAVDSIQIARKNLKAN